MSFKFNFDSSSFKKKDSNATESGKSDTTADSKTTPAKDSKNSSSNSVMKFDFSKGGGLSFDTSKKKNDTSKAAPKKLGLTSGSTGYDNFLKERRSSGKNSLNQKKSTTNPPKLTKKKEDLFEVHYVPISGVHFDRIFIQKESVSKDSDDLEIGESFNQPTHVSRSFEDMYN